MAETVFDGTMDWSLGQDSWHPPAKIRENQYWRGVNLNLRGGVLTHRPAFEQLQITFEDRSLPLPNGRSRSIKNIWEAGKFQAMIPYSSLGGDSLIIVISGLIFSLSLATNKVSLLSEDIKLNQYRRRINWSVADKYLVLFDYPDYPVIIEGSVVTRSSASYSSTNGVVHGVPASVLGTYNQNRLFVGGDGSSFTSGDAVGNLLTPDAPITFSEVFTPSSLYVNQSFSLGTADTAGHITAMGFLQQLDEGTGIGPLLVATNKSIYFYKTNQPRDNWTAGVFGGVLIANAGIAGPRAFVNVNSDILFMSREGNIHAVSTARAEAKRWGNVPISREVNNWTQPTDGPLSELAVMGYHNGRILCSVRPYRTLAYDRIGRRVSDFTHGGFVVLDTETIASLLSEGTPAWSGIWTGICPMEIATIAGRCFVISKDGDAINALYEINEDGDVDIVRGCHRNIASRIYTRAYDFKDPYQLKREHSIAMHLQDIQGCLDLEISRKPSHGHRWMKYATWKHCAPVDTCKGCYSYANSYAPHKIRQLSFGDPLETGCNPITNDELGSFSDLQFKIDISAPGWVLEDFRVRATVIPTNDNQSIELCSKLSEDRVEADCETDWGIPEVKKC